jgi:hypothetical protein
MKKPTVIVDPAVIKDYYDTFPAKAFLEYARQSSPPALERSVVRKPRGKHVDWHRRNGIVDNEDRLERRGQTKNV